MNGIPEHMRQAHLASSRAEQRAAEGLREASLMRQRASREYSKNLRSLKDERDFWLSRSTSTKQKRKIKKQFSEIESRLGSIRNAARAKAEQLESEETGAIYDVDTYVDPKENKATDNDSIHENSIDTISGLDAPGDSESSADGNGIPDGYVETEVTLCQNGSPVTGTILFKAD